MNTTTNKKTPTFADKLKIQPLLEFVNPKDDQGLVFNCVLDYKLRDYLEAIEDRVYGAKNIIAASKVSKNRIIIHLQSKKLIDEFFDKYGTFQIESNTIKCRRLTTPNKKVILSHVNPSIPNSILENFIQNDLKLNLTSNLSYLRLNPHDQKFGHIASWRRQFYTNTEIKEGQLPGSFLIQHNEQAHRIFITMDEFTCFKCHIKGHRAEDCPTDIENQTEDEWSITDDQCYEKSVTSDLRTPTTTNALSSNPTENDFPPLPKTEVLKRPLSESSSSTHNTKTAAQHSPKISNEKNSPKKLRKENETHLPTKNETQTSSQKPEKEATPTLKEILAPVEQQFKQKAEKPPISV